MIITIDTLISAHACAEGIELLKEFIIGENFVGKGKRTKLRVNAQRTE